MLLPSIPIKSTEVATTPHADYVIDLAKKLADGKRPGILSTVDKQGMPYSRWMATLSLHDWPLLYTITSPTSQKIQHIIDHPSVSWMFSNEERTVIINIRGRARIARDFEKMERVWKLLEDKSKAYFLTNPIDGPSFAVIETEIEDIDAIVPQYDIRFEAHAVDLECEWRGEGQPEDQKSGFGSSPRIVSPR
jgi:general stress protein 26